MRTFSWGAAAPQTPRDDGLNLARPSAKIWGVGENLSDHTSAALVFSRKTGGTFQREMRFDRIVPSLARAYLGLGGFAADLPFGVTAFLRSAQEVEIPDVQLLFWMGATTTASPWLPPFKAAFGDSFSIRAMPMRPESRGHLSLASSNPGDPIQIHQNFLHTDSEWQVMRRGLRMIRDLAASPALKDFAGEELAPGADAQSDAELDAHVKNTMITVHHPVGTCKMGSTSDTLAVVDDRLRVHGIEGLRVIDSSIMPTITSGNTNAPTIMIAEKASDMILQDSRG